MSEPFVGSLDDLIFRHPPGSAAVPPAVTLCGPVGWEAIWRKERPGVQLLTVFADSGSSFRATVEVDAESHRRAAVEWHDDREPLLRLVWPAVETWTLLPDHTAMAGSQGVQVFPTRLGG